MFSALGFTSVLRAVFKSLVGQWEWYDQLFLSGGIFLLILGILALFAPLIGRWIGSRKGVQLPQGQVQPVQESTSHVYFNRQEIGVFKKQIDGSVEVWALWHTAQATFNSELFSTGRIKRLMLPNPNNPEIATLAEMTTLNVATMRRQIEIVSRDVRQFGTEVRWWSGHITNAITLGNPEQGETWGVIEAFLPKAPRDKRPRIEFSKANQPDTCDMMRRILNEMWHDPKRSFDPNG